MERARKCDSLVKAELEMTGVLMERPRAFPDSPGVRGGGSVDWGGAGNPGLEQGPLVEGLKGTVGEGAKELHPGLFHGDISHLCWLLGKAYKGSTEEGEQLPAIPMV